MIETAPFPLALGPGPTPSIVVAAEKYVRDRSLAFLAVTQGQVPHIARDLVSGAGPTTPAPGKLAGFSPLGVGMVTDATNGGMVYATPASLPASFANLSLMYVGVPNNGISTTFGYCACLGNTSGDPDVGLGYDVTNTRFRYGENSTDSAAIGSSPLGPLYVVVTTKAGTAKKMFVNGVRLTSTTGGQATRPRGIVALGRQAASTASPIAGTHLALAVWGRTLTDDEAIDLSLSVLRAIGPAPRNPPVRYFASGAAPTGRIPMHLFQSRAG